MRNNRTITAATVGPLLLGGAIAGLSVVQYDFMRALGWHPVSAPTVDWPSGLALGPHGWLMDAAFVISGVLLARFGHGAAALLAGDAPPRALRWGGALIVGAGLALALLAFRTDPTNSAGPRTWHGNLHDAAYVALGTTLLPGMALLGAGLWQHGRHGLALYTALTLAAAVPGFVIKGWLFYAFLAALLAWFPIIARRGSR